MSDADATKPDWMRGLSLGERIVASQQIEAEKIQGERFITADQQIRAKALECVVRLMEKGMASDMLLKLAEQFERYIREGK